MISIISILAVKVVHGKQRGLESELDWLLVGGTRRSGGTLPQTPSWERLKPLPNPLQRVDLWVLMLFRPEAFFVSLGIN